MFIKMSLLGLENLEKVAKRAAAADAVIAKQMYTEATTVLNESKRIVPVDTGALKGSGRVERPQVKPGDISVEISYGGAAAKYAWYVHEDPSATHAPGTTYKYLEIPFMAHADKFARNVKAAYAIWLNKGL